jgi:hypothetical protein
VTPISNGQRASNHLAEVGNTEFERAVDATPGIDPWCSGPDWVLSVRHGFSPESEAIVVRSAKGMAMLARYDIGDGDGMIAGFEPLWGFACPIVGPDPDGIAMAVAERLSSERWGQLVLPGFPEDLELARRVAAPLSRFGPVGAAPGIVRRVADLEVGSHWRDRRPRYLRRNLRQAGRRAIAAGLRFVDVGRDTDLMDRLLAIEQNSWKGKAEDGITSPTMEAFYRNLIDRLQAQGRCRSLIAIQSGRDLGFILGGIRNGRYRGLQLSYIEEARHLSLGHLLQEQQLDELTATPEATVYDLGMDMAYKEPWSDRTETSITLVVHRVRGD